MVKKNGMEKWIKKMIQNQQKEIKDLKQIIKEEKELKAIAFALLKEHKLRMDMHWGEIVKRTSK